MRNPISTPSKTLALAGCALALIAASGCATDINSRSYSDRHVGEAARSYRGTVVKVSQVKVGPDELGKSRTGALVGGLGGAVLGNAIGGGRGTGGVIGTIGGAAAGAIGGAFAERALKTQTAYEIVVELKNGELLTVVQGRDVAFSRGERVLVMVSSRGRSKVTKEDEV